MTRKLGSFVTFLFFSPKLFARLRGHNWLRFNMANREYNTPVNYLSLQLMLGFSF
jgi:hypothetical protein